MAPEFLSSYPTRFAPGAKIARWLRKSQPSGKTSTMHPHAPRVIYARQAPDVRPGRHRRRARRSGSRCVGGPAENRSGRAARDGGEGEHPPHRAGAGEPRLRAPPRPNRHQPGPGRSSERRRRLRSAHRARPAGRHWTAVARSGAGFRHRRRVGPRRQSTTDQGGAVYRNGGGGARHSEIVGAGGERTGSGGGRESRRLSGQFARRSGRHHFRPAGRRAGQLRHRGTVPDAESLSDRLRRRARPGSVEASAGGISQRRPQRPTVMDNYPWYR